MIATFPLSIQFLESSRCHIRDFGNDGAGTWYSREEDVDSLPLKMVFANREGDMESASFMCRQGDKSVYGSEWTWTYEKWWSIKQLRRGDGWSWFVV